MKTFIKNLLVVCMAMVCSVSPVIATTLDPVSIRYKISLNSERLGNATLGKVESTLSKTNNGYSIETVTKAEGMAAILMGSNLQESCEFSVDENRAKSSRYDGGRIGQKDYYVNYDWQQRKVNFSNGDSHDMPQGYVIDNCIMWFATAILKGEGLEDEPLYVVDGKKKRIRGFTFISTEEEVLRSVFGEKKVIKLSLHRELRPDRKLTFWLSPDHQYLPLKIVESRKSRTTTFEMEAFDLLD